MLQSRFFKEENVMSSFQPYSVLIILFIVMALFIWGRWRYDIVALIGLMVATATGAVPFALIYSGLSNPAVITVACVMIISAAISRSGVLAPVVRRMESLTSSASLHVGSLSAATATLSAFMNNVGALAMMMPVAIQSAYKARRSPSLLLMPLALASALGGLITLIGTPPNLLISNYRQQYTGHPYHFFDFAYVGLPLAIVGVVLISTVLWRLVPGKRKGPARSEDAFSVQDYVTEILIPPDSPLEGMTVREFEEAADSEILILGYIRKKTKRLIVNPEMVLHPKDIVILEVSMDKLQQLVDQFKLELVGNKEFPEDLLKSDDVAVIEAVVPANSSIDGRSAHEMRLRSKHKLNLLAISREGKPFKERLHDVNLRAGDVVLLQGLSEDINETISSTGFLPLAERGLRVTGHRRYLPILFFFISILLSIFTPLPVQVSFGAAVIFMLLFKLIPISRLYDSIDWSIIILLAALIPIGTALESTGGTTLLVKEIVGVSGELHPVIVLFIVLFIAMTLTEFMNNAATAVIMAPIAVSVAQAIKVNIDPFLMAVAVGCSCSFLTPVGHQNNTLVLGPGGYKFFDYIRLGLPLEILMILIGMPLIVLFWPL